MESNFNYRSLKVMALTDLYIHPVPSFPGSSCSIPFPTFAQPLQSGQTPNYSKSIFSNLCVHIFLKPQRLLNFLSPLLGSAPVLSLSLVSLNLTSSRPGMSKAMQCHLQDIIIYRCIGLSWGTCSQWTVHTWTGLCKFIRPILLCISSYTPRLIRVFCEQDH